MYKFLLIGLSLLAFTGVFAQQDIDFSKQVPFDESFRIGVLPNGLTYYIKQNPFPKSKASFYLCQNVGAVLENDEQNGLAHFLEHMAFNGTKHFPGNSMVDMLEKKGVKFGKEINAYTSTNETVYNLSRVPLTNEKVLDSCLLILNDWCNELTLSDDEIDAERNVIQEEWRQMYNASYRLRQQTKGVKYNHSIYSKRDALGSMDVVENFKYKALRDFYHDWYRTDLQAIGIIGDFNVDEVEQKIKDLISKIPAIKNPKPRTYATIPDNEKPLFKVATDKEVSSTKLTLEIRHFYKKDNSQAQLRESFVNTFFMSLMADRFKETIMKGDAPYTSARAIYADFEKNYKAFNLSLTAKDGKVEDAFKSVYSELQRVVQHGFTQAEIDRLKSKMLTNNEKWAKPGRVNSDSYGRSIKEAYLQGTAIPTNAFSYNFAKMVIPTITKEEVSQLLKTYLTQKNRVFTITAPENSRQKLPVLKDIKNIMEKVESTKLEPYVFELPVDVALLEDLPDEGEIIGEKINRELKAVEWQLANGAKVVYRHSNYKKGHMELKAVSNGGASVYGVEDIPSFKAVNSVNKFGIGELDPLTYSKVMAENSATSKIGLETYAETVSASASNKDIGTLFQLVYMRFEHPRFDEDIFNNLMANNYKSLENPLRNPNVLIGHAYKKLAANSDPRFFEYNKGYLDKIDFDRMTEIYNERFGNAANFTFYLIGDAPFNTVRGLVKKYFGSLKSNNQKETFKPLKDYFPKGFNKHRVELPIEAPMATQVIKMQENVTYNRERIVHHKILGDILNIRFIENIREKEGGVYAIGVNAGDIRKPSPKLSMDISFNCDPKKSERLNGLIYKEIEQAKQEIKQADLDKVLLNLKKSRPSIKASNAYGLAALEAYYEYNEDIFAAEYYEAILDKVTTNDIVKAAKMFFNNADILDIIFLPEAK